MASLCQHLTDVGGGSAEEPRCGKDLFAGGDVVALAGEKKCRAGDILEVEPLAESDKAASDQPVFLEDLADDLEIPGTRQIDRVFVPAFEGFEPSDIARIIDMLLKFDELPEVLLDRMHTLEAFEHEGAP